MSDRSLALVVDDEDLVREVTVMMLEDADFTVIEAQTGDEALSRYDDSISVAVLDFSMPGMSGYQLALKLRERNPQLPLVMMSGLAMVDEVRMLKTKGALEFVSKPFEQATLMAAVRRAKQGVVKEE